MSVPLDREVIVVVGTGGVGKTTLSAILGLAASQRKQRVLIVTIDPAQRLADALGLDHLTHNPTEIRLPGSESAVAISSPSPRVWAMMLDTKRTFEELVERYARDPESQRRIHANPIFQNLTDAVSGSREYSAMEKLYQLHASGDYDLIVLDTPPASHALHFLDAPRRLTGFLDSSLLRVLLKPAVVVGRSGFRALRRGTDAVISIIQRITGLEFLQLISDFLIALEDLWEGLAQHADALNDLLRSDRTGFVLVVQANAVQARRAVEFAERLDTEGIELDALVVNRMQPSIPGLSQTTPETRERLHIALSQKLDADKAAATAAELCDWIDRSAQIAETEEQTTRELQQALGLAPGRVSRVPRRPGDLHTLDALHELIPFLSDPNSDA